MINRITLLLFIGLAFWGCEKKVKKVKKELTIDEKLNNAQNSLMVSHAILLDSQFDKDSIKAINKLKLEYWNSYNEKHKQIFGKPYPEIEFFRKFHNGKFDEEMGLIEVNDSIDA